MNPNIFKAYDVRALYPSEIDEATARLIGRGFVAYLGASDDRRVARHAAVVAVAGRRVHRWRAGAGRQRRRLRSDGHRHDVFRRRQRGPAGRRANHRVAQPAAIQRHQDGAAGGAAAQRRRGSGRDPRHDPEQHAAGAGGDARPAHVDRRPGALRRACLLVHRQARRSSRSSACSMPATAWAGWWRRGCSPNCPARSSRCAWRSTGAFRTTKPTR